MGGGIELEKHQCGNRGWGREGREGSQWQQGTWGSIPLRNLGKPTPPFRSVPPKGKGAGASILQLSFLFG